MLEKRVLNKNRVRKVPRRFSWVDHQLMRGGYVERCDVTTLALYLVLVTVGDAQGLSYYSDKVLCGYLSIDLTALTTARRRLIEVGLIAYGPPLYQVLSIETLAVQAPSNSKSQSAIPILFI